MKKKRLLYIYLLLNIPFISQAQKLEWLKLETSVTGDFIKNLAGGINNDYTYIGMEELALTIDYEAMGLWQGGEVFLHGLNAHGRSPSQEMVGDLQVSSNIEAGDYTGLYEYYFKQTIGNFSFLIGQHDLNSEFVGTEYGGTFINSSFGITPSMSLNIPVSIYPTAAPALIVKYQTINRHALKLGMYDGDPGDTESNRYNLQPNINRDEGLLFIGEYEYDRLINGLPENYKLGAYYHTSKFVNYDDTLKTVTGNYGVYGVADFVLWSGFNHPDSYLGLFVQSGWAPSTINQVDYYVGGGMHLNGILPERYNDAMGLAFAYVNMGNQIRKLNPEMLQGELSIEFTYKFHVFDNYFIQPNLQYIINPGVNPDLENSLVALMRLNIALEN